jgi:hypothetical protein
MWVEGVVTSICSLIQTCDDDKPLTPNVSIGSYWWAVDDDKSIKFIVICVFLLNCDSSSFSFVFICYRWRWTNHVPTPLWDKCEDETHTPKSGKLESSGTPKNLEFDNRGQNTSHWGVLYINGKVLKCRCRKLLRIDHLDIWSPSYGQKKGQESNW